MVEGKEGIRGCNGWMASPMQWIWTWANFRRWWGAGRPGVLQSMGSQRVGHDWVTEHNNNGQKGLVTKGKVGKHMRPTPSSFFLKTMYVCMWFCGTGINLYTTTFKNYWGRKGELQGMEGRRQSWVMESHPWGPTFSHCVIQQSHWRLLDMFKKGGKWRKEEGREGGSLDSQNVRSQRL